MRTAATTALLVLALGATALPMTSAFLRPAGLPHCVPGRAIVCRPVARHSSGGLRLTSSSALSDAETYDALARWLHGTGGHVHPAVQFTTDDLGGGRGLQTSRDVKEGERLVVLPEKAQLFYKNSQDADQALLAVIETVNPSLWGMRLGLRLLQEKVKSETSFFSEYLNNLPTSYDGMPAYYTAQETQALQFPDVQRQAAGRLAQLTQLAATCQRIRGSAADPFAGADIDLGALTWATASVSSRAYRVRGQPGQRGGHLASLLPIADLINHSFDANCVLDDAAAIAGAGAVAVTTCRAIPAGEPLRINYGEMSSDQLLLSYGFVVPDNPFDTVQLPAGALSYALQEVALEDGEHDPPISDIEAEQLAEAQMRLLQDAQLTDVSTVTLLASGALAPEAMALVRVLALRSPQEAAGVTRETLLAPLEDAVIEARARLVVKRLSMLALDELPTSVADDVALLEGGGAGGGTCMTAVEFRAARKRILCRAALVYA